MLAIDVKMHIGRCKNKSYMGPLALSNFNTGVGVPSNPIIAVANQVMPVAINACDDELFFHVNKHAFGATCACSCRTWIHPQLDRISIRSRYLG